MATILHVDMDAFFASVELLHHPEWRGKPLIVGSGPHERGVVSTCSYEARTFGVHSAMPSRTAYALCPQAIFTPPHGELYKAVSHKVFEIFEHYTPYVEGVSIDEAFLDITGSLHLYETVRDGTRTLPCEAATSLGEALRREIRETCGITCSVGIAPNRLLAKLGSEAHKPDGLTLMPFEPAAIAAYLAPRPVGILWGIGAKTAALLKPYGLVTCGDIQRLCPQPGEPSDQLRGLLGEAGAHQLAAYAFGISDDRVYWQPSEEKSVSNEYTFDVDEYDRGKVRAKLLELVTEVGRRFRREKRWARTAKLKLRDTSFNTITRQIPFDRPARDDIAFREKALALFDREKLHGVRLIGFGVTNLQDAPDDGELQLFADTADATREKHERLAETLDALRQRGLDV